MKSTTASHPLYLGWTTVATAEEARQLASESIRSQLAACAQVDGPVTSHFVWEDEQKESQEYRIVFKVVDSKLEAFGEVLASPR